MVTNISFRPSVTWLNANVVFLLVLMVHGGCTASMFKTFKAVGGGIVKEIPKTAVTGAVFAGVGVGISAATQPNVPGQPQVPPQHGYHGQSQFPPYLGNGGHSNGLQNQYNRKIHAGDGDDREFPGWGWGAVVGGFFIICGGFCVCCAFVLRVVSGRGGPKTISDIGVGEIELKDLRKRAEKLKKSVKDYGFV